MRIPEKYICDIKDCENEVPKTSTGKRDDILVQYALTSEFTGDRLYTNKERMFNESYMDLCPEHQGQLLEQMPISGEHDGTGKIIFTMRISNEQPNTTNN